MVSQAIDMYSRKLDSDASATSPSSTFVSNVNKVDLANYRSVPSPTAEWGKLVWKLGGTTYNSQEFTNMNFHFYLPYINSKRKYQYTLSFRREDLQNDFRAIGWEDEVVNNTYLYKLRRVTSRLSDYLRYITIIYPFTFYYSVYLLPYYFLSAMAYSSLVNPFNKHWRQCAVMSERVVNQLYYNQEKDEFTIILGNGSSTTVPADQLRPALDANDSITDMVESLRDEMRDMYYCNFNYLWIDDGKDHDLSLHQSYYNNKDIALQLNKDLKANEGNYNFVMKVKDILSKYKFDGDKKAAETEIANARKSSSLTLSVLVDAEVQKMVEEHFSIHYNGDVIDLVVTEVAQNDVGKLKEAFDLSDEDFGAIRSNVESKQSEWQQTLTSYLEKHMSLNLACPETVEMVVGLSLYQMKGGEVNLPTLEQQNKKYSYDVQSLITQSFPDNFKVVHSNLLAFPSQCELLDQSIMERIYKNKMTFEEYEKKYMK